MPRKGGWDTLQVKKEIKDGLKKVWESDKKKPPDQKFNGYLNSLLNQVVQYQKTLKRFGPLLEIISADGTMINIYDHLRKQAVTVYIDREAMKLQCSYHKDDSDCVHVGYCFGVPQAFEVLVQAGFRAGGYYVYAGYNSDLTEEGERNSKKSDTKHAHVR